MDAAGEVGTSPRPGTGAPPGYRRRASRSRYPSLAIGSGGRGGADVPSWPGGIWEVGEAKARLGLRGRGEGNGERWAAIRFARSCQRPRRPLAAEAVSSGSIFGLVGAGWCLAANWPRVFLPAHQTSSTLMSPSFRCSHVSSGLSDAPVASEAALFVSFNVREKYYFD